MKKLPNKAKCLICNETIHSTHRHDYVTCKCGNVSVDGGNDYHKMSWKDLSKILLPTLKNNKIEYISAVKLFKKD